MHKYTVKYLNLLYLYILTAAKIAFASFNISACVLNMCLGTLLTHWCLVYDRTILSVSCFIANYLAIVFSMCYSHINFHIYIYIRL